MQPNPLFSVLIANYNNGKYLEEALQSVFAQTYTNWEIILVDDASTDNSNEIYQKYNNDQRIHIYYNDKNYGCGYTKHRCVELANGEICGFLDPDDALVETALEETTLTNLNTPNASLVYTNCYICGENLEILAEKSFNQKVPDNISLLESGEFAPFHFATFKKSLYHKTNGINPSYQRSVDWDLFYKLEEIGELLFIDKKLYYYRKYSGNNLSTGDNENKAAFWRIIVTTDACLRRKLNIEKTAYKVFDNACISRTLQLKKQCDILTIQYKEITNNFSFKLGKFLTAPFRWIKKMIIKQ